MLDVLTSPYPFDSTDGNPLTVRICLDRVSHVIWVEGDLDWLTRDLMIEGCAKAGHRFVVVGMTGLAFMDCAGYGGLIASRRVVERRGGSLAHATGEPLRLLAFIDADT